MSLRERFEAWARPRFLDVDRQIVDEVPRAYLSDNTRVAWATWRAAYQSALGEAALWCEIRAGDGTGPNCTEARYIAKKIRIQLWTILLVR